LLRSKACNEGVLRALPALLCFYIGLRISALLAIASLLAAMRSKAGMQEAKQFVACFAARHATKAFYRLLAFFAPHAMRSKASVAKNASRAASQAGGVAQQRSKNALLCFFATQKNKSIAEGEERSKTPNCMRSKQRA
jgi:hypothetical protein